MLSDKRLWPDIFDDPKYVVTSFKLYQFNLILFHGFSSRLQSTNWLEDNFVLSRVFHENYSKNLIFKVLSGQMVLLKEYWMWSHFQIHSVITQGNKVYFWRSCSFFRIWRYFYWIDSSDVMCSMDVKQATMWKVFLHKYNENGSNLYLIL